MSCILVKINDTWQQAELISGPDDAGEVIYNLNGLARKAKIGHWSIVLKSIQTAGMLQRYIIDKNISLLKLNVESKRILREINERFEERQQVQQQPNPQVQVENVEDDFDDFDDCNFDYLFDNGNL